MKKLYFKEVELEELNSFWEGVATGAAIGAGLAGGLLVIT
ncbi:hypothetical protein bcgnr5406_31120 [Bacillus cereus]|uniref:Uncharacterized protein n=1 Tax=Bacillus cereus TaxID=1396 RepID=A0A164MF89_BACCE|nr:hypothetical protein B4088_4201 [Bacillus cereus]BCD27344.1 hypothetical protein BC30102_0380 [Bacillus cereus]